VKAPINKWAGTTSWNQDIPSPDQHKEEVVATMMACWTRRSAICFSALVASGCALYEQPTEPKKPEEAKPWIAIQSVARARNPLAWIGDEHNRLVDATLKAIKAQNEKGWVGIDKCRWIAQFVVAEAASARAPEAVRSQLQPGKINREKLESDLATMGCNAGPAPGMSALKAGRQLANLEIGDTVDYEPSSEALGLLAELDGAVANSAGPSELDASVASIQGGIGSLWDGEVVYGYASTMVSSGYYWQSYEGGGSGGEWVEGCTPPACYETIRADFPVSNLGKREVIGADAMGFFGGSVGGSGLKMTLKIAGRFIVGWPAALILGATTAAYSSLIAYAM
jgi:hypothetical protein